MDLYHYSPSVTFVMLTADQFVGRDDDPLKQQRQDSHICRRNCTFPLIDLRNTTKTTKSKKQRIHRL